MNSFELSLKGYVDEIMNYAVSKAIIDESALNDTVIPEGAADQFVDLVTGSTPLLAKANYQNMGRSKTYKMSVITAATFVLSARPAAGTAITADGGSNPTFAAPKLISTDLTGYSFTSDEAIEVSIVGDTLVDDVMNQLAAAVGRNIEMLGIYGDTDITPAGSGEELQKQTLYSYADGWVKGATNKIYATSGDFDDTSIADVLDKLLEEIDDKYIDEQKMVYELDRTAYNEFSDLIADRHPNTSVGVDATTGKPALFWRGIQVEQNNQLPYFVADTVTGGTGRIAMLGRLEAFGYGMPEDIMKTETWRERKEKGFYSSMDVFPAVVCVEPDAIAVAFYTATEA